MNIESQTPLEDVQLYDTHKCENCKKLGNKSFSLVEEENYFPHKKVHESNLSDLN